MISTNRAGHSWDKPGHDSCYSPALSRAMTRLEALIPGRALKLRRNRVRAAMLHQIVGWFVGRFVEQLVMSLA